VKDPNARVQAQKLYDAYKFWCEENGHRPQSSTRVAEDWQRLGYERKRISGVSHYHGLRIRLAGE
jgi:phage/plasmid-associated DNA primase